MRKQTIISKLFFCLFLSISLSVLASKKSYAVVVNDKIEEANKKVSDEKQKETSETKEADGVNKANQTNEVSKINEVDKANKDGKVDTVVDAANLINDNKFILNEQTLKDLINNNTVPEIQKINTAVIQSNLDKASNDEAYAPKVSLEGSYEETNETATKDSSPILDSSKSYEVNLEQKLPYGVHFDTGLSYLYERNVYSNDATTPTSGQTLYKSHNPTASANLTIDLWKNFLGYSDVAKIESLESRKKENEIQAEIMKNQFYISMRKIYWRMVANDARIEIYKELIKKSEEQKENTVKMYKSSIADSGDVAKSEASVASRRSQLINLEYQQEVLKRQLKEFFPELNTKEIILADVSKGIEEQDVMNCINMVVSIDEIPYEYTKYDDLVKNKDTTINKDLQSVKRHSDLDVKLTGGVESKGDSSVGANDSYEDMNDGDRTNYSISLKFSMPLGKSYGNTKENQMKLYKTSYNYQKNQILSNIISMHNHFKVSSKYLLDSLEQAKIYSKNTNISFEVMKKKYYQGRVPLSQLIQYEDDLLSSELEKIEVEYQIVGFLLDYISVFSDTKCKFNTSIL
jgi:outer membrane protein TolC